MHGYILSEAAENDVQQLFADAEIRYGFHHAISYLEGLDSLIEHLVTHPEMGTQRPEIRDGLRGITYQHHIVLYRLLDKHIRIVRIVGGEMDLPNLLFLE